MTLLYMTKIKLLVADESPIILAGIRSLVRKYHHIEVVGETTSAREMLALLAQTKPNVVIVEPSLNGIPIIGHIVQTAPGARVICLSEHGGSDDVREAFAMGARGCIPKNSTGENLRNAIEAVSRGGQHVGNGLACQIQSGARLGTEARSTTRRSKSMLTDRERAVLRLFALGFTSREIAAQLGLTAKSIETYKTRASAKLDLRSRPKIIQYAILQGWFQERA